MLCCWPDQHFMQKANKEDYKRLSFCCCFLMEMKTKLLGTALHKMAHTSLSCRYTIVLHRFHTLARPCHLGHCMKGTLPHFSLKKITSPIEEASVALPLRSEVGSLSLILLAGCASLNYRSNNNCLLSMSGI